MNKWADKHNSRCFHSAVPCDSMEQLKSNHHALSQSQKKFKGHNGTISIKYCCVSSKNTALPPHLSLLFFRRDYGCPWGGPAADLNSPGQPCYIPQGSESCSRCSARAVSIMCILRGFRRSWPLHWLFVLLSPYSLIPAILPRCEEDKSNALHVHMYVHLRVCVCVRPCVFAWQKREKRGGEEG